MSDDEDTGPLYFRRSPMIPMTWAVRCPGCEELIEVAETDVTEPADGVYEADASIGAPWIKCDDCGTLIEIIGVKVDQKIPTPGVGWL